jgi:O-methyltransferase involved in polyketide biosynthesis
MAKLEPERDIPDVWDVQDLWYFEEREDVGDWLRRNGWDVTERPAEDLLASYGRTPPDVEDAAPKTIFVAAERTGEK